MSLVITCPVKEWKRVTCVVSVNRKISCNKSKFSPCRNYFNRSIDNMNFCYCHANIYDNQKDNTYVTKKIEAVKKIQSAYRSFLKKNNAAITIQKQWKIFYKNLCRSYLTTFRPKFVLCNICINSISSYTSHKLCANCRNLLSIKIK